MSWLSKLFKTDKRDTTYQGPKPVTSLNQVQGGPEYYKTISGRMAGEGVGFGEQYASQASNPVIARMRNQFKSYDIPELASELSATGRRRGSAGFDQMRRAYEDQSLAEGDVYSGLYQQNEAQKRNEMNDALGRMGQYASNEANLVGERANFDYADNQRQVGEEDERRKTVRDLRLRGIGAAMSFIPGGQTSSMGGTPTSYGQTQAAYTPKYSASQVNSALKQPTYSTRLKLK